MKTQEARELGKRIAALIAERKYDKAVSVLELLLEERIPFKTMDLIGAEIGAGEIEATDPWLERIAATHTEGGWVVIASALWAQYGCDAESVIRRSREYIVQGDVWYVPAIFGERVCGPALVDDFDNALGLLDAWRTDANRWVRRAVGMGAHYWAKRARGQKKLEAQAERLLEFLTPLFAEWEMDAVKGIAWGLKTLGKHYPVLMVDWLIEQLQEERRHRALMVRKAMLYMAEEQRERVMQETGYGT